MNAPARPRRGDGGEPRDVAELRLELERLRAFVEIRVQSCEAETRALVNDANARVAEWLEPRFQLATGEAIAFAEQRFERHEGALRALGGRVAAMARESLTPSAPETPIASPIAAAYLIGAGDAEAGDCVALAIPHDSDECYARDLARLPILPGGATRLVVAHVVEYVDAAALTERLLPHWRSLLAPCGELTIVTLDGPAWAAELIGRDGFEQVRKRLGADGVSRPVRHLLDADRLRRLLTEAGFTPAAPRRGAPHILRVSARRT